MSTRRRRPGAAWIAILLACTLGAVFTVPVAAEVNPAYRGRLLVEVLDELRSAGLPLVYSSAVVPGDLRITAEPTVIEPPDALLHEILQPLGLTLASGPADTLLVVRDRRPSDPDDEGASEPPAKTPLFITEVIVTPSRHSIVREERMSTRTLDSSEAVLVPTIGGDVSRIVELLPGVAAADGSAAFNVRGSTAQDVSLVLDGLELYDPYHLTSFQSPFSLVDSQIVDRITFFGGGFTADYGDRHGGLVDISTFAPGDRRRAELQVGTLNSRLAYQAPLRRGLGAWLVSARGWYPDAVRASTELGADEKLDPRFADVYAKVALQPSLRHSVSAHTLFAYDRLSFDESGEELNETVDALTRNTYAWFRAFSAWSERVTSETVLSFGRIERLRDGVSSEGEGILVNDDRTVDFVGLRHGSAWELGDRHAVRAGFELRRLDADYDYSAETFEDPAGSTALRLTPDGTSSAAFASWRVRLSPAVATELGLRWDRQTHTGDDQLGPRFNAVWRTGERSELRVSAGRHHQSQRIHELRVEDGESAFAPAEVSDQTELSFRHELRAGPRIRIDLYERRQRDLRPRFENLYEPIELFPETVEERVRIVPEKATLRGIELLVGSDLRRPVFWWVGYTASSAEDRIDGVDVPRSWDQPHAAKFLVGYRKDDRWSVSLTGSLHTGWPTTPVLGEVVTLPDGSTEIVGMAGERNSDRFDTYARLDVKARRAFDVSRGRVWLTVEILNVGDRDNACCLDEAFFLERPDGSVDVLRKFDHWLGFTPSVDVRWEF